MGRVGGRRGLAFRRWTPEKTARFVRDWNEGLENMYLKEKYGVVNPGAHACELRQRGLDVVYRGKGLVK